MPPSADDIWNRACDASFRPTRGGDQALAAVIGFHSLVMSGGVVHSLEVNYAQAGRAAGGFRLFGADDLGQLVGAALQLGASLESDHDAELTAEQEARLNELEQRYGDLVPSDSRLSKIFEAYLTTHPEEFEPLR
jgi:hypothetical protein